METKFKRPDKGEFIILSTFARLDVDICIRCIDNADELLPVEGKDEAYDEISAEIAELEDGLEKELKKLKKQLGCDLTYWHSAQGTKVTFPAIFIPVKKPPDDRYR